MQRLIIRLGSELTDPIQWLVFSEQEQEIIASGQLKNSQDLPSLKERASSAEVFALAPVSDIYFTRVELPKNASRKVLAAIPFMIEEELCGDINELFFAQGNRIENAQEVAVVSKKKLKQWQNAFVEADLFCAHLYPDAYCLDVSDTANLVQIDQSLIARLPDGSCLQGETTWLLPLVLELTHSTETSITCFSDIDNWPEDRKAEFNFDLLPMQLLLNGALNAKLNLFQNEFAVKRKGNPTWNKWKLAAALAVIAICANLLVKATEFNNLKSERTLVRQQISSTVKQGFPDMGAYRFLRTAVEKEIVKLEKGGGNLSMLAMLSRLSGALESSGIKPQNMRYDSKRSEIRMQSVAQSFEALEKFRRDAQGLGFEVEQGPINNRGTEVVGVITVRG